MKNKLDIIKKKYENIIFSSFMPTNNKMNWFILSYTCTKEGKEKEDAVLYGIDTDGNIIIVDGNKQIKTALYMLNNVELDISLYPTFYFVGKLGRYADEETFCVLKKYPDQDFIEINKGERDLVMFVLDNLERALSNYYEQIDAETEDYFHVSNGEPYAYDQVPFNRNFMLSYPKSRINYDIDVKDIYAGVGKIRVFPLIIPVLSRKQNKIINPYIVFYFDDKHEPISAYVLDTKDSSLSCDILNVLNNFSALPDLITCYSAKVYKDLEKVLKKHNIIVEHKVSEENDFFLMSEYATLILGEHYDFFTQNKYIEFDDCVETVEKITAIKNCFMKYTDKDGVDYDTIKILHEDLYNECLKMSLNSEKTRFILRHNLAWYVVEQFYFGFNPDEEDDEELFDLDDISFSDNTNNNDSSIVS